MATNGDIYWFQKRKQGGKATDDVNTIAARSNKNCFISYGV
jgi:hypothetical protein